MIFASHAALCMQGRKLLPEASSCPVPGMARMSQEVAYSLVSFFSLTSRCTWSSIIMLESHGRASQIQVLIAMQVQQLVQQGDAGLARLSQLHPQIVWPSHDDSAMAPAEVCADCRWTDLTVPSFVLCHGMACMEKKIFDLLACSCRSARPASLVSPACSSHAACQGAE